jgi:hypothetical protein
MEQIRSSIALISLGLLLTMLGHDALMASAPHPLAPAGHTSHAGHHEFPAPPDGMECGPTAGVHPKPSTSFDVTDSAMSHALPWATDEIIGFFPHWSVAPGHPPDIRRALLQVYLN